MASVATLVMPLLQRATRTIRIVFFVADPVAEGCVSNTRAAGRQH